MMLNIVSTSLPSFCDMGRKSEAVEKRTTVITRQKKMVQISE